MKDTSNFFALKRKVSHPCPQQNVLRPPLEPTFEQAAETVPSRRTPNTVPSDALVPDPAPLTLDDHRRCPRDFRTGLVNITRLRPHNIFLDQQCTTYLAATKLRFTAYRDERVRSALWIGDFLLSLTPARLRFSHTEVSSLNPIRNPNAMLTEKVSITRCDHKILLPLTRHHLPLVGLKGVNASQNTNVQQEHLRTNTTIIVK